MRSHAPQDGTEQPHCLSASGCAPGPPFTGAGRPTGVTGPPGASLSHVQTGDKNNNNASDSYWSGSSVRASVLVRVGNTEPRAWGACHLSCLVLCFTFFSLFLWLEINQPFGLFISSAVTYFRTFFLFTESFFCFTWVSYRILSPTFWARWWINLISFFYGYKYSHLWYALFVFHIFYLVF